MFTNEDIVKLRKRTNAGIMDCKNALTESDGDLDKATEWLREKGIAKAAKKADRIAAEGLVYSYIHMGGKIGVLEEINCETDFVARSDNFVAFCKDIALQIAAAKPLYVTSAEVPTDVLDHEKEILRIQALNEGKPEAIVDRMIDNGVKGVDKMYPTLSRFNDKKSPNVQTFLAGIYRKTQVPDAFGPLVTMLIQNSINPPKTPQYFNPNEEIGGAILSYLA